MLIRGRVICGLVLLALAAPAGVARAATTAPLVNLPPAPADIALRLPADPVDPLGPFHLSLGASPAELAQVVGVEDAERLKAGPDTYHHFATPPLGGDDAGELPAPDGLSVLAADFFVGGERLVEASLVVQATLGRTHALQALRRQLGEPDFDVVLPGALDMVVGWRTADGCLLAWFSDLEFFRVSVFRADAHDLLAGAQVVLYDGLLSYSQKLAAGAPASQIAGDLMKVVTWVAMARASLEPVR